MSKQTSKQTNKSAVTAFCKFCEGAGESKEVYTSHWQFSQPKNGVLTCPKLLNYNCKLCNCRGHIEKRCPAPIKKKERIEKFCRFCYNANISGFAEHNQFDKDGFVQCPTLLDIECQNCGKKGHTKRYCNDSVCKTVITKPGGKTLSIISSSSNEEYLEPRVVPGVHKKPGNKFSALLVEEIDEEDDTMQTGSLSEFPMLSGKQITVNSIMGGWSTAVKGNTEPVRTRPAPPSRPAPEPETVIKSEETEVEMPRRHITPMAELHSLPEQISDTEEDDEDNPSTYVNLILGLMTKPSTYVPKQVTSWADAE